MSAASTPSNTPPFMSWTLPLPRSSAGQPMTRTRPRTPSSMSRSARNAPIAAVPMRLWPHPWPIPGSASYSPSIATTGPPDPASATKAVSTPPAPRRTATFSDSRYSASALGARMDLQREPVERLCARVDALGDPLLTRRGVQVVLRLPRTRRGTRGQNELGQDESGNDESPRDDAQSVHGAKETERGEKGPDLDPATDGRRALWPAAPRACERCVPLLDGHADQRDRARHADGGPAHNGRDRE